MHLGEQGRRVVHERDRAERRAGEVERAVGERQGERVGLHQRYAYPGAVGGVHGVPQHAGGQVEGDRPGTLGGQPAGGGRGAAAHLQHPSPGQVAEQSGIGLAQPLRAPDEVHVAEERAVLGLVVVGVAVPPAPVGPPGLGVTDPAPGHPAVVIHPLTLGPAVALAGSGPQRPAGPGRVPRSVVPLVPL
ncbi:hypothetical protein GCM10027614_24650 [Micromonospora vulcania]